MIWELQEAKNRLGQIVQEAQKAGPQVITVHGKEAVVVISLDEYRKLTRKEGSLVDFFLNSPLRGAELDLERSKDTGRDIEL